MSRRLGIWEQRILAVLERQEGFYLVDLLRDEYPLTMYSAMNRAGHRLAASGRITLVRYRGYEKQVYVARPDWQPTKLPPLGHDRRWTSISLAPREEDPSQVNG